MSWVGILLRASLLCLALFAGCGSDGSDAETNRDGACSPEACEPQCAATDWVGLDESYWVFEASCDETGACLCRNRCDDTLCEQYCREEQGREGGSCGLVCDCYGARDGGPADGG